MGSRERHRKIDRKCAAFSNFAFQLDLASEQAGKASRDCKTKACAAELSADSTVGLLKCFKDSMLLIVRNTDACIRYHDGDGILNLQGEIIETNSGCGFCNFQCHTPMFCKFNCIRHEVFDDLKQPLHIRFNGFGNALFKLCLKLNIFRLCERREGPDNIFLDILRADCLDFKFHLTGFYFREVKNVVDQFQKVRA